MGRGMCRAVVGGLRYPRNRRLHVPNPAGGWVRAAAPQSYVDLHGPTWTYMGEEGLRALAVIVASVPHSACEAEERE